jgi:ABC-type transport system substrate-binding protein
MKREKWFALVLLFILGLRFANHFEVNSQDPIANLVMETNGGGVRPDYGLFIAQYLRDIGIEIEVKVEEWAIWIPPFTTHNYDIGLYRFGGGGAYPGARDIWTSDGSLNIFGLGPDIPYQNESEEMQNTQTTMTNITERQTYLYTWQELMMDKIVSFLPLFSPKVYKVVWANTHGYDENWGIRDSLPYMSYDGYHIGQDNLTEFNFADANWKDLNPLYSYDGTSTTVQSFVLEPIVQMNPDFVPVRTGLVYDWVQIDETHYQFWMMDDVWWNPSYNSTARDKNSIPLVDIPIGDYMIGLKDGLPSNGSSHQVTAKDAVFTYLAWANSEISDKTIHQEWISDCYVDPVDPLSFHVHIDANPETPEVDPYADMWASMQRQLLPEFFLNSTSTNITHTVGGVECTGLYSNMVNTPQWVAYSTSAFGCGPYSIDYRITNSKTVLRRWDGWHDKGAITGETGLIPFVDTINILVIPDTSAELAEFKAGGLDWADVTPFTVERKIMQGDSNYIVNAVNSSSLDFMYFNLRRPFIGAADNFEFLEEEGKESYTKACAVRKAICYAIDRDEINQIMYEGEYEVAHSVIYPSQSFYYYDDIIKYNYDLDDSFEWLEAAGYIESYKRNKLTTNEIITASVIMGVLTLIPTSYGLTKLISFIRKRGLFSFGGKKELKQLQNYIQERLN